MGKNLIEKEKFQIVNVNNLEINVNIKNNDCFETDVFTYIVNNENHITETICYQNLIGYGIQLDVDTKSTTSQQAKFVQETHKYAEQTKSTFYIDLNKIKKDTKQFIFGICIFEPKNKLTSLGLIGDFFNYNNIFVQISNEETQRELCHFILPNADNSYVGCHLFDITKTKNGWEIECIESYNNENIIEMRERLKKERNFT